MSINFSFFSLIKQSFKRVFFYTRILLLTFVITTNLAFSQSSTISGYVHDKKTGEVLIGATVYQKNTTRGTSSNSYGFFSLSLPKGNHTLVCSYIGYENYEIEITLQKDVLKNFNLLSSSLSIDEVMISADKVKTPINTNEFKVEKLAIKDIKKLPNLLGEADVIKAVQLQTGVKTIGEGSSGMFVRGGSSDQNLIIIDEAPIYNPSHMFGLISVFNSDAINNVQFYKSNMPAQYGGRTSAVLDCKMKEGSLYDYNFSAGLSPLSVSLYADGPLVKENSAFLVSVRKSIVDLMFSPKKGGALEIVPGYYDVNIKLNTKIGNRNRLFLSFYDGADKLESVSGFYNKWSNRTATLRWNRNWSAKWFSNVSLIYSDYKNNLEFTEEKRNYTWHTGVNDLNFKFDNSYYVNSNNTIKIGVNSIFHKFIPGETGDTISSIPRIQALENSFYILNDVKLTSWLGLNYGLRISLFQNCGKTTWYEYDDNHELAKTKTNTKGIYNTEKHFEPRISANVKLGVNSSVKLAYARNAQYMQVLQNSSLSYSSLETWFPSNRNIKPILADVISTGWFQNIKTNYLFSVELYYKASKNRIDYIDHASLINNPYIEAEIRNGTEEAFGFDIELKKTAGKFTGFISYSFSSVHRKINDVNNNKKYSAPYDIPHDIRLLGNYKLNKYWTLSSAWVYTTGRAATLPTGFYYQDYDAVPIYSDRNSSRFPDYHRLDIATTYSSKPKNKKTYWDISFGIYNLYSRKNPIGYEFNGFGGDIIVQQHSLFSIMPNFSIKVNF